jgi:hypothetical protein
MAKGGNTMHSTERGEYNIILKDILKELSEVKVGMAEIKANLANAIKYDEAQALRLRELEKEVGELQGWKAKVIGWAAGTAGVASLIVNYILGKLQI